VLLPLEVPKLRDVTNGRNICTRQELRRLPEGVLEYDIPIPVRDGVNISASVYSPEKGDGRSPVNVDFHGGGYCIGTSKDGTVTNRQLAALLGIIVVSAAYRLAAEHNFPVAVYDALDAVQWAKSYILSYNCR